MPDKTIMMLNTLLPTIARIANATDIGQRQLYVGDPHDRVFGIAAYIAGDEPQRDAEFASNWEALITISSGIRAP